VAPCGEHPTDRHACPLPASEHRARARARTAVSVPYAARTHLTLMSTHTLTPMHDPELTVAGIAQRPLTNKAKSPRNGLVSANHLAAFKTI
jgi:hypothetical protein